QSGSSTPFLASAAAVLASSAVCSTCFCVAWPIAFCCWTCPFSSRISSSACRSFSSRSRSRFSVGVSAAARPEGRTRLAASTTTNTNDCFIPTSAVGVSWSTSSPLASLVYNRPVAETTLVVHNWPADRVVALLRQWEVLVEGSAGQPHTRSANGERCRRLAIPCSLTSRPSAVRFTRSEEHTSELQSRSDLVCRLL